MAHAEVEERQLLKAMTWWDGFVVALANPGFLIAALGASIGALGTTGAFVLWSISITLGALQNNIHAELAGMFPSKSGGISDSNEGKIAATRARSTFNWAPPARVQRPISAPPAVASMSSAALLTGVTENQSAAACRRVAPSIPDRSRCHGSRASPPECASYSSART